MEVLKKTWWFFCLLGIAAAFFNPYIGMFAMIEAILMFVNGCFVGVGRIRCRNKNRDGFQGIAKIQSSAFWPVIFFNIVVLIIFIKVFAGISNSPQRTNMGFIPLNSYDLTVWVPAMWVLFITSEMIYLFLLSLRLYDLYWNKNYTMKPRKVKFGFLKQPDTDSWWFRIWRGTGKIWFIFAICSFVAGSFNYPYPVFTCFRFFFFFPFGILWINIRTRLSAIRRCSNKQGSIYEACDSRAQHELDMFRGKGMFLTSIIELWVIEAVLIITACIAGAAPLPLSLSILCDVLFISSMCYHVWGLAEKR